MPAVGFRSAENTLNASALLLFFSTSRRGGTNCGNGDYGDQHTAQLRKPPSARPPPPPPHVRCRRTARKRSLPPSFLLPLRSRHHSLHARSLPPPSVSESVSVETSVNEDDDGVRDRDRERDRRSVQRCEKKRRRRVRLCVCVAFQEIIVKCTSE